MINKTSDHQHHSSKVMRTPAASLPPVDTFQSVVSIKKKYFSKEGQSGRDWRKEKKPPCCYGTWHHVES